jgi:predicted nucleotidyltransferase
MEQSELLRKMAETLDKLGIAYAVVGSTASTMYGDPRLTNDIDIVIDLQPHQVDAFCSEFPDAEFYLSRAAVESAVRKQFQFNIIHPASGFKVDCFIAGSDPFDRDQLDRAVRVPKEGGGYTVQFAAPEDVVIKKMEYFRIGESEKHIRDICGILKHEGTRIDRDYIGRWAERKGLAEIWGAILARLSAS